ncbi:putative RNA methyltransferase [Gordonia sp. DT30]|uniref:putative RNA methyltransferase n=1 Tax=Gordonia sp. DT30 TaxID=3416546 RepID=UPI003CF28B15
MPDLRCPICTEPLHLTDDRAALRCDHRHSFDIARQGYVSLLDGHSGSLRADTADMVAARLRVHDAGILDPVVDATAGVVAGLIGRTDEVAPLVADLGGGPGAYLRACLRRVPPARGVVVDLSKYCARAVVRSEPAAAAVVADVWRQIPLRTGAATIALSVFAPRNVTESARVLGETGHLVIVSPQPDHLNELVGPLGMVTVAPDKDDRIEAALSPLFEITERRTVRAVRSVGASQIADLVGMGPSAFHHDRAHVDEVADAVAAEFGGSVAVTVAVTLTVCRPAG